MILFVSVSQAMYVSIARLCKCFRTIFARIRFLLQMHAVDVNSQMFGTFEWISTLWADVLTIFVVNFHVRRQWGRQFKAFVTHRTTIRINASIAARFGRRFLFTQRWTAMGWMTMVFQLLSLNECFFTRITFERTFAGMGAQMNG